nr:MAG TPA: hypothetical protein [Caudoviricetes sp.]
MQKLLTTCSAYGIITTSKTRTVLKTRKELILWLLLLLPLRSSLSATVSRLCSK